ncbi:hypothetical protein QBC39DRAFT_118182 [Podospora conica]|nr:hypothetical protein QBC39DRAFT_118182 [Schizothecium conicum]
MDSADHIVPSLTWSCPTKEIAFGHPGKPLNIRNASEGHFAIYGDYSSDHGRFVVAISFEEEKLPVLGRQVIYHYLDAGDNFIWETEGCLELTVPNNVLTPTSELDRKVVMWRIRFGQRELITLQSMLSNLRLPDDLLKVNTLPKSAKDMVYYNLRSRLMELPVPRGMGCIGHWQRPQAGGTPGFPPYVERAFINQCMDEIKSRQQDVRFPTNLFEIEQQQEDLDFADATSPDRLFDNPGVRAIYYVEPDSRNPGYRTPGHRTPGFGATGTTTPSGSKVTGKDQSAVPFIDSKDSSDDDEMASDPPVNMPTQTLGAYNSKRTRRSSTPTEKASEIKTNEGMTTIVGPYIGQAHIIGPTPDMGALTLRGGGLSPPQSRSVSSGTESPDDLFALMDKNNKELCRWFRHEW